jgi:hypothetical protein
MNRFYQISARWLLALTVTITITQLTRGSPPRLLLGLFANPDGSPCEQPCLLGVRPEMPYEQALTLLQAHPFTGKHDIHEGEGNRLFDRFTGQEIEVSLTRLMPKYQSASVSFVRSSDAANGVLRSVEPEVRLGEIVAFLGAPEMRVTTGEWATLIYFHGQLLIVTSLRTAHPRFIDPKDPVLNIILMHPIEINPSFGERAVPWRGFGLVIDPQRLR